MLALDITLAGDASSSQTYSFANYPAPTKSLRGDRVAGAALPRTLTIGHSVMVKGTQSTDRHLVRLDLAKADAVTGEKVNIGAYLVIEMPRTVATVAQLKDMITQLKNLLSSGNIDMLLNNEL
jgi:hypothetical protein